MKNIQVLDCTLRDGGYCNDCNFGYKNIQKIVRSLLSSNIDIIELGFYKSLQKYDREYTRFSALNQLTSIIPAQRKEKIFVLLADYDKFDPDTIPKYDGTSVDGFRISFHKKDKKKGIEVCKKVMDKGYKVFVQPMVSVSYTDEEFLDLIQSTNEINPYAFYIVDSFGMMKNKDLTRLFYMVEHNLNDNIKIGFHSHNNMQLAYSNAQNLIGLQTMRDIILDSSVYGMGRGAGNLNTELLLEYLNENLAKKYDIKPLLTIIDEVLNDFYEVNPWGYSLPNYLSACHNIHPNYAKYFDEKKTLTVEAMNEIFSLIDEGKKFEFDKMYAERVYVQYMSRGNVEEKNVDEFNNSLIDKKILLLAPGKSSVAERKIIQEFSNKEDVITISINFDFSTSDYIFVSNRRRFKELNKKSYDKCIATSNIQSEDVYLKVDYTMLLTNQEYVEDNAGLMAIKFLMNRGVKDIYLAGFDGYAHDDSENYGTSQMTIIARNVMLDNMNKGINKILREYAKKINIHFLTKQKYISIND